ncbi:hypothetical protein [Actinophytocola sp.]|uniref:hypothetical protein n=1 Tax=Actinophytocola sp. TaxID=1872138 RepID=UPI00389A8ABB
MTEGNPLLAESEGQANPNPITHPLSNFTIAPTDLEHGGLTKSTEGAGLFNDVASTIQDGATGNWGGFAMDLAADGLDGLGMAMDPLGSLAGAGIGWLIEHVSFLKKPLDWLAGDPEAVTAKAQTLQNVAEHLRSSAENYVNSVGTLQKTQGQAADGYRQAAQNYQQAVNGLAAHVDGATQAMHTAAMIVGTTRSIVRDSISQFVGDAIVKFIAASALAPVTFGGSEAVFIADEVAEGASLAASNAGKVSKVVRETEQLAKGAKKSETALRDAGEGFERAAGREAGKVDDFNTRAAAHTERVHEHGARSQDQLGQEAAHNERAVDNEQNLGANRDALGRNQNELDRSLRDHDRGGTRRLNREREPLKDENRALNQEDRALNRERHDLEQSHNQLRHEGNDINHDSGQLAHEREEIIDGRVEDFHDHGIGPAGNLHRWVEDHPAAGVAEHVIDAGKEAGMNVVTNEGTRTAGIQYEYEEKLEEQGEIPDGSFVEERVPADRGSGE